MVWVLGNHDRHLAHLVAKLFGIETTETFRWSYGGRSYVALHGDRFDCFISNYTRIAEFLSRGYAFIQRWLSRPASGRSCSIGRMSASAASAHRSRPGARGYASDNAVDVIVCGHTHRPSRKVFDETGPGGGAIEYFNTGCWVEHPASFVTVGAAGAMLNHFP